VASLQPTPEFQNPPQFSQFTLAHAEQLLGLKDQPASTLNRALKANASLRKSIDSMLEVLVQHTP
jgi:hypothetical protein